MLETVVNLLTRLLDLNFMYLFYIDESGDTGRHNSPTKYFVLSAICVHESAWQTLLDDLIVFRKYLKDTYGLKMTEEIHAAVYLTGNPGLPTTITKNHKVLILRDCLRFLNNRSDISITTVRVRKSSYSNRDVFDYAWSLLLQRIHNTINAGNFVGGNRSDKGVIICDDTDSRKLRRLLRAKRRYNKVPSKYGTGAIDAKLTCIIEDPVSRDSKSSYIHQMVDVVCYFARQYYEPNSTVRKKSLRNYYTNNLSNVINKHASPHNKVNHIVEVQG